jgi:hypothetical protein
VDFQPGLRGSINLTTGELQITKDLSIVGPGPGQIKVSGNNLSTVFDIRSPDPFTSITVTISGLTIEDQIPGTAAGPSTTIWSRPARWITTARRHPRFPTAASGITELPTRAETHSATWRCRQQGR